MKKLAITAAMVFMAVVGVNHASAEMVDIGLGQMELSEFRALEAMVQGRVPDKTPAVAAPPEDTQRYGLVEMSRADYEALRDMVTGRAELGDAATAVQTAVQMVNIGTGEMPLDEFLELKRMVSRGNDFIFDHLAVIER